MKGSCQEGPGGSYSVSLGRLLPLSRPPFLGLTWAFKGRCREMGSPAPAPPPGAPAVPRGSSASSPGWSSGCPGGDGGGAPSRGCSGSPTRPGPHPQPELYRQSGDSQLFFQGRSNWASAQRASKPRSSSVTTTGATGGSTPSPSLPSPTPILSSLPYPLPRPLGFTGQPGAALGPQTWKDRTLTAGRLLGLRHRL